MLQNKQSKKMRILTNLNELPVTVDENCDYGVIKGLIYINEYNMSDLELFRKGLIEKCGIQEAVQATWMTHLLIFNSAKKKECMVKQSV